jgi:raffinose/stachyose/melibiose transport system permease protein
VNYALTLPKRQGQCDNARRIGMSQVFKKTYSYCFLAPAAVVYGLLFIIPTAISFYYSLTRWNLFQADFIGLENYITFFQQPSLLIGFKNTLIYAGLTCLLKAVFGLLIAVFLTSGLKIQNYLRSIVFFPALLSSVAVGLVFSSLMWPSRGLINETLKILGITGPDWLGNPQLALYSVILVDFWKGVGIATVIYLAGLCSIPPEYYEAFAIDGGNGFQKFRYITLPLVRPAINSVIILALIGGMRSFDLVWVMTKGGPGFATDLMSSIVFKQFGNGYYGLSTAGNVLLFVMVSAIAFPLYAYVNKKEVAY